MPQYEQMTDEQLIRRLREGDRAITDYLMEKYKGLVKKEAKAMYLLGGENDDLIQEGMIGLFKAVQDYDTTQEASFYSFARLCVRRQLYSAIEASRRKKHTPLNSYISLYERENPEEGEGAKLMDTIQAGTESDPEQAFLSKDNARRIEEELEGALSDLERRVPLPPSSGDRLPDHSGAAGQKSQDCGQCPPENQGQNSEDPAQ